MCTAVGVCVQQKLMGMASQFLGLGLLHADEKTYAMGAALAASFSQAPTPKELLTYVRELRLCKGVH
jgi:hypothetical protein